MVFVTILQSCISVLPLTFGYCMISCFCIYFTVLVYLQCKNPQNQHCLSCGEFTFVDYKLNLVGGFSHLDLCIPRLPPSQLPIQVVPSSVACPGCPYLSCLPRLSPYQLLAQVVPISVACPGCPHLSCLPKLSPPHSLAQVVPGSIGLAIVRANRLIAAKIFTTDMKLKVESSSKNNNQKNCI